jgi:phospholipid/cholesterol/gamma-HCH transport system substrate-binding protein
MKASKSISNIKLGLFVIAGLLFLILSLYMIGRNRNLFGPTFKISASFKNINGLMVGNNVRFSGIDVGTVSDITITSDSSIMVEMIIEKKVRGFIRGNAIATIGTDGLMGNKLVNINSRPGAAGPLENGSTLQSEQPIETDEMLRTLSRTNDNMHAITANIKEMSERLNESNSLWTILADKQITVDLKSAMSHLNKAVANTEALTRDVRNMISTLKDGNGLVNVIFTDTVARASLEESVRNIELTSQNLSRASVQLTETISTLDQSKGPAGMLISDSVSTQRLQQTVINIEEGTKKFNENMEALQHHFLFKKYSREQAKEDSTRN